MQQCWEPNRLGGAPASSFGCKVRDFLLPGLLPCSHRVFLKADLVLLALTPPQSAEIKPTDCHGAQGFGSNCCRKAVGLTQPSLFPASSPAPPCWTPCSSRPSRCVTGTCRRFCGRRSLTPSESEYSAWGCSNSSSCSFPLTVMLSQHLLHACELPLLGRSFDFERRDHLWLLLVSRTGFVKARSVMHLREQLTEKGKCSSFTNAEKGNVLPQAASASAASPRHQTGSLIECFSLAHALTCELCCSFM